MENMPGAIIHIRMWSGTFLFGHYDPQLNITDQKKKNAQIIKGITSNWGQAGVWTPRTAGVWYI